MPKEKDAKTIGQFRTISLLNVEGKIFLSVLVKRISVYMVDNGYIDTSIQKAGIPGFSGCVEHTSVLTQLIKEGERRQEEPFNNMVRLSQRLWISATQTD